MTKDFNNIIYSKSFNNLTFYGAWPLETNNIIKKKLFSAYQFVLLLITFVTIALLIIDLHLNFNDLKKVSWNLCGTTLYAGGTIKLMLAYHNSELLNKLRKSLFDDLLLHEDSYIDDETQKQLKYLRKFVFACAYFFIPIWLVSRFMSITGTKRLLPIPIYTPWNLNSGHDVYFIIIFIALACLATGVLFFVIEQELAMFSILFQLKREYNYLKFDVDKLDEKFQRDKFDKSPVVINPVLQKTEDVNLLKKFCSRQQKING